MSYFVLDENNCLHESMTKEEILSAIVQAVEEGEIQDVDTGFVTKIREINYNRKVEFWVGTQAEFNAIEAKQDNVFYLITDPTLEEDFQTQIDAIEEEIEAKQLVDITSLVTLSTYSSTPSNVAINDYKYTYDPNTGIVYYWVKVSITGSITTSNQIFIKHTGSYPPAEGEFFPCSAYGPNAHPASFYRSYASGGSYINELRIRDTTTALSDDVYAQGFYYTNV